MRRGGGGLGKGGIIDRSRNYCCKLGRYYCYIIDPEGRDGRFEGYLLLGMTPESRLGEYLRENLVLFGANRLKGWMPCFCFVSFHLNERTY